MTKSTRNTLLYIVVVLAISWGITAFAFSSPRYYGMYATIMLVPAFAASVFDRMEGRPRFGLLASRPSLRVLGFSVGYPVVVLAVCAGAALLLGWGSFHAENFAPFREKLMPAAIFFGFLLTWGEERGWRGYLLPRLAEKYGRLVGTLLLGTVWALFHGPVLYLSARALGTGSPLTVAMVQMSVVVLIAFPFSYVYFRSGSILPPMLLHLVWNLLNPPLLGNLYQNVPGLIAGDILLINGEGVLGILVSLAFVPWFAWQFARTAALGGTKATHAGAA